MSLGAVPRRAGLLATALLAMLARASWADLPPNQACGIAGHAAEQAADLPANLLVSIGMVESGRPDPLTGRLAPWPWTVNADGTGQYFMDKTAAEAYVRMAEAAGARDIDVGCFQISLQNHPNAFASLDDAFDPVENADYAAKFLNRLKSQTGSWNTAIADYHSAEPDLGLPYQRRVLAVWHGLGPVPAGLGAQLADATLTAPDPYVILMSPQARRIHVYTPANAAAAPPGGLPRVITP